MSLSYEELTGGLGDVVSPEQLVSQSFNYRQSAQMHGMGQGHSGDYRYGLGKKSCCRSCAGGGPCASGLGATTVHQGQADLEPGDYGYQYASTTKPNTTVFGRQQGRVGVDRRMALTRQIEELEFLAGTPNIHPQALASKVWAARRALMGVGDWAWASYADPSARYDAKSDLEARLAAVERVLGVGQLSPRLMIAYGQGAGLGGGPWGTRMDPVKKLAQCIRGAICAPSSFCCPPGRRYSPPAGSPRRRQPPPPPPPFRETGIPFRETGIPFRETGIPFEETRIPLEETGIPFEEEETIIGVPGGETGIPFVPAEKTFISVNDAAGIPLEKKLTGVPGAQAGAITGGVIGAAVTGLKLPYQPGTPGMTAAAGAPAAITPAGTLPPMIELAPTKFTAPWQSMQTAAARPLTDAEKAQAASRQRQAELRAAGGGAGGSSAGTMIAMGGLGGLGNLVRPLMNMRAINDLRESAMRARAGARRRSR